MVTIVVAFIVSFAALFLGMMLMALMTVAWPAFVVFGLYLIYREHNTKRRMG